MRLSNEGKETIEKIRQYSGKLTPDQVRDFFDSLIVCIFYDYLDDKSTYIPYLGELKLKFVKDEITAEGKEAIIDLDFKAAAEIRKAIGQARDNDDTEIEKLLRRKISNELGAIVYEGK